MFSFSYDLQQDAGDSSRANVLYPQTGPGSVPVMILPTGLLPAAYSEDLTLTGNPFQLF